MTGDLNSELKYHPHAGRLKACMGRSCRSKADSGADTPWPNERERPPNLRRPNIYEGALAQQPRNSTRSDGIVQLRNILAAGYDQLYQSHRLGCRALEPKRLPFNASLHTGRRHNSKDRDDDDDDDDLR